MTNSPPTEHRAFLLLLGALTLVGLYLVSPFLNAIVLAIALAILFQPLHGVFLRWTGGRPNAATFLSVSSVVFLLLLPLAAVMTLVTGQLSALVIPSTETPSEVTVSEFLGYLQQRIVSLSARFERLVGIPLHLDALVRKGLSDLAAMIAPYSPKVISETVNFFMHLFIFLVLLTYFLRDGKAFLIALIRITPIRDHYEHRLAGEIRSIIQAIFYGQFLTSLLQAIVATAAFYFLGIDGYLVWGCLIFFVSFLPLLGTGAVLVRSMEKDIRRGPARDARRERPHLPNPTQPRALRGVDRDAGGSRPEDRVDRAGARLRRRRGVLEGLQALDRSDRDGDAGAGVPCSPRVSLVTESKGGDDGGKRR
jgi:predicted PurR-regulated permease PerM